ncbi:hypothetical protein MVEN_01066900 [Mycena venus]|uniref:Uncharacterized protein n=1 Tax=Mycena venus TaxID=2733690 RepID=A0A8H6Y5T9_9AGAR|nr:hypothetical protein MVEN_01066900 [Mycena venus]
MTSSVPSAAVVDAASKACSMLRPVSGDEMRCKLEWAWGLERGTLDEHLGYFVDPHLVDVLLDDNLILIAHSDALKKIFLVTSNAPLGFVECRTVINDLYSDSESFEYLVLPVDPSNGITPRSLVSRVPPHLTISSSVDKIFKRWSYGRAEFKALGTSVIKLVTDSPPTGATFKPNARTFIFLRYIHEGWATRHVPPRFLGIEEDSDDDEESAEGSGTMEWEVSTVESEDEEPQSRLLPHEFETDPVPKFQPISMAIEDDAISIDSHITGVEGPEEFYKVSLARGVYETDPSWSKGIRSWAQGASGIDDEKVLLNDGQIETDPREKPRVATSLNLDKPDWQITAARTR